MSVRRSEAQLEEDLGYFLRLSRFKFLLLSLLNVTFLSCTPPYCPCDHEEKGGGRLQNEHDGSKRTNVGRTMRKNRRTKRASSCRTDVLSEPKIKFVWGSRTFSEDVQCLSVKQKLQLLLSVKFSSDHVRNPEASELPIMKSMTVWQKCLKSCD